MTTHASLGALYIVTIGGAVVFTARRLGSTVTDDPGERLFVNAFLVIAELTALGLGLGAATILTAPGLLVGAALVAIATALATKPVPFGKHLGRPSGVGTLALTIGVSLAVLGVVPAFEGHPSGQFETRAYHVLNLATWLRTHSIWTLPFQSTNSFRATHPGNGEIAASVFAFATRDARLLPFAFVMFGTVLVIAVALIARELGGRADVGALSALALIASPIVFQIESNALQTDLAACAAVASAVFFSVRAYRTKRSSWFALAGVAAGMAVGTKYDVFVLASVIAASCIVFAPGWRSRAYVVAGSIAYGAPWLLRNLATTGNPIYPEKVHLPGITLPSPRIPVLEQSTTLAHHMVRGDIAIVERWLALGARTIGPVLALVAIGVVAPLVRRERDARSALALFCAFGLVVYLVTPFTGGGPNGVPILISANLRYALPVVAVAIGIAAASLPRVSVGVALGALAYGARRILHGPGYRFDIDVPVSRLVVVVLFAVLVVVVVRNVTGRITPQIALPATAIGAWVVLALFTFHAESSFRPTAIERLVRRTHTRRIAVVGITDLLSVMGERFERTLVSVSAGGRAHEIGFRRADAFERALERSGVRALAIPEGKTYGVPSGWSPDGHWRLLGQVRGARVFVKR